MKARPLVALVVSALFALGACGGGNDKADEGIGQSGRPTRTTLAPGDAGGSGTTSAGGSNTTRKPAGTGSGAVVAGQPGEPDVAAVAPGTYKYTVKGTANAKGSVRGAPLDTSKPIDKTWEVRYLKPQGATQRATYNDTAPYVEHVLLHSAASADFTVLRLNTGGNGTTFSPNPPARFMPVPAGIGARWSWTMTSKPDSKGRVTTRSGEFRVERTDTLTIDGAAVPVVVIMGTVTVDQPLVKTAQLTIYYSEAHKLVVREREITDSDLDSDDTKIHLHTDATTTIGSLKPQG